MTPRRCTVASGNRYTLSGDTVTVEYVALGTSVRMTFADAAEARRYAVSHGWRPMR